MDTVPSPEKLTQPTDVSLETFRAFLDHFGNRLDKSSALDQEGRMMVEGARPFLDRERGYIWVPVLTAEKYKELLELFDPNEGRWQFGDLLVNIVPTYAMPPEEADACERWLAESMREYYGDVLKGAEIAILLHKRRILVVATNLFQYFWLDRLFDKKRGRGGFKGFLVEVLKPGTDIQEDVAQARIPPTS